MSSARAADRSTLTAADPVSDLSPAEAVAADLARRIRDGELPAGTRTPSERELADAYGVGRAPVRTALAALARQGLVVARPHAGWVVQARFQTQTFDRMRSFAQWAAEHGRAHGGRVVVSAYGPADAREARVLGVRLGAQVLRVTRLRSLDGVDVMIERSVWAPWVAPVIAALPADAPTVTAPLAEAGVDIELGDHRIEAVPATSADARLLGVRRSSPLLQVSRVTSTRDGRPVEVGEDRYVPHVFAIEVSAGR